MSETQTKHITYQHFIPMVLGFKVHNSNWKELQLLQHRVYLCHPTELQYETQAEVQSLLEKKAIEKVLGLGAQEVFFQDIFC